MIFEFFWSISCSWQRKRVESFWTRFWTKISFENTSKEITRNCYSINAIKKETNFLRIWKWQRHSTTTKYSEEQSAIRQNRQHTTNPQCGSTSWIVLILSFLSFYFQVYLIFLNFIVMFRLCIVSQNTQNLFGILKLYLKILSVKSKKFQNFCLNKPKPIEKLSKNVSPSNILFSKRLIFSQGQKSDDWKLIF